MSTKCNNDSKSGPGRGGGKECQTQQRRPPSEGGRGRVTGEAEQQQQEKCKKISKRMSWLT